MPTTFRNRTARCRHSISLDIRCPTCRPYANDDEPDESRHRSMSRYRIGEVVAGITIIARSRDNVLATCGCGDEFKVARKTVAYWVKAGGVARCRECRAREAECVDVRERIATMGVGAE